MPVLSATYRSLRGTANPALTVVLLIFTVVCAALLVYVGWMDIRDSIRKDKGDDEDEE